MSNAIKKETGSAAAAAERLSPSEADALRKSFADDGFFVIRDVISNERLAELHKSLSAEFDRMKQTGELFSGGGMMSGHLNCFPGAGSRFVFDTLEARGVIDLIRQVDPNATRMPNVGCNFNLPGSVIQHYHMDRDYTKSFTICNIALVDTVVENGAMELIPASHKRFYKYWQFALERPTRNAIRMPMKQGDIMVRSSNVWHRGMPNRTAVPRPMMALTWEDGGSSADDPFAVEGGAIKFRPNWFRPTRLGRIRERMFVKLPLSYSAYRFVTSLYTNKGY